MADSANDKLKKGEGETIPVGELPPTETTEDPVILAEVSIPDFPTPFYHSANPDGTRKTVKLSELKEYLSSLT